MKNKYEFRLKELRMSDFMSVEYGRIVFSDLDKEYDEELKASVTGIYGSNGAGKTTIFKALQVLMNVLGTGDLNWPLGVRRLWKKMSHESIRFVRKGCLSASLSYSFYVFLNDVPTGEVVTFSFSLRMNPTIEIFDERLVRESTDNGKETMFSESKFESSSESAEKFLNRIFEEKDSSRVETLYKYYLKMMKTGEEKDRSRLFRLAVSLRDENISEFGSLIISFSRIGGLIIPVGDLEEGNIREGSEIMLLGVTKEPGALSSIFFFCEQRTGVIFPSHGCNTEDLLPALDSIIDALNQIMMVVLPDTRLEIEKKEDRYFLRTRKEDGRLIEFEKESYGVRKLIMLSMYFPLLFINPYVTLVIDEIDEGIFEFLLGKILEAIYDYGVGQLIFTAHNLRPLEILPHKCIRFAIPYELNSKNVKNRYRKLKCTNKDSMLRDVYYRMFSPSHNEQIESMGTMED